MKVKVTLNHTDRVKAIKELRQLTGMGLKEAVDKITVNSIWGDSFEVDCLGDFNQNDYTQFKIADARIQKEEELKNELKSLICKSIWSDEVTLAQNLLDVLWRANNR